MVKFSIMDNWKNKLYFGDNLDILREHVASESVDLIYLDPPFNSNATYNVLFQEKSGEKSAAQITAFEDTWHLWQESEYAYRILITLEEPTKPMLEEAATAGYYEPEHFPGSQYPRIQILTIRELLNGKEAQYPRMAPPATFKRAQRHRKSIENQQRLV